MQQARIQAGLLQVFGLRFATRHVARAQALLHACDRILLALRFCSLHMQTTHDMQHILKPDIASEKVGSVALQCADILNTKPYWR